MKGGLACVCASVYVRMYVFVCSFALFRFALLAVGRFFKLPNRHAPQIIVFPLTLSFTLTALSVSA